MTSLELLGASFELLGAFIGLLGASIELLEAAFELLGPPLELLGAAQESGLKRQRIVGWGAARGESGLKRQRSVGWGAARGTDEERGQALGDGLCCRSVRRARRLKSRLLFSPTAAPRAPRPWLPLQWLYH